NRYIHRRTQLFSLPLATTLPRPKFQPTILYFPAQHFVSACGGAAFLSAYRSALSSPPTGHRAQLEERFTSVNRDAGMKSGLYERAFTKRTFNPFFLNIPRG